MRTEDRESIHRRILELVSLAVAAPSQVERNAYLWRAKQALREIGKLQPPNGATRH